MTRYAIDRTALTWQIQPINMGRALVAWTPTGVRAVLMADDDDALLAELRGSFPGVPLRHVEAAHPWVNDVIAQLDNATPRQAHDMSLPLDLGGTVFQQTVWAALRQIPPGRTVSYSELAHQVGRPRAVRAVASACAANVLAVLIPCHRVVRSDGSLSGYRWGLARKQALLAREAVR